MLDGSDSACRYPESNETTERVAVEFRVFECLVSSKPSIYGLSG